MRWLEFLGARSRRFILTLGIGFVAVVGSLDYLTGSEVSFSIFYVLPIATLTWYVGRRAGLLAAVASATIWLSADLIGDRAYSSGAIPYWNAVVRLGFFLIVTFTLASLRAARLHQEELGHYIVHDLRSPLSNVIAALQFLLDTSDETLDNDQQNLVQISLAACNRMLMLVNSLLDLAQLESGRMRLSIQNTQVRSVFETTLQQVSAMALESGQRVESCVEPGAETALADAEIMVRVLVNLVSNAIKHSPSNTRVTLSAAPNVAGTIIIRVGDSGPGIPREWVSNVFDRFAQVEARRQGVVVGSGLGLSFCRLAVEAQGGHIWLDSEVGKGTTVSLTLPSGSAVD